jgi:hypothetical protein
MSGFRRLPIHNFLNFAWIDRYALARNSVPQKFNTIQPKLTLGELSIEFMLSQAL